jgi:signal transduction histidine kinase
VFCRSREIIGYLSGEDVPVIVHTAPIRNKDGDIELVIEISADVTEIRRLQEELRTTQQRYQQLFDEAPCYISVQDRALRLVATNRRFKEDFDENLGSYCYEVYKNQHEPCTDCPVVKTFEDGKSHQSEMVVTSKTGEQNNLLIWTAPIRDESGEISQVMEMSTNITQVRKLQDHLSAIGLKIGSISHGIKGLLTRLDGGIYLLDSGFAKENEELIKEGWSVVRLMIDRIKNMVLDILYFAKERDLIWERVDVLSLASDVVHTVEPKMEAQDITLVKDFDPTLGKFEVDAAVIRSALINILENATDACMEDPSKALHEIIFRVNQDKNHIIFDVHDTGVGMDKETKENLFNLFFSSKGSKGTGLGLFISYNFIQQHGGSITVESTPGQGSHFSIRMPKIRPESVEQISWV